MAKPVSPDSPELPLARPKTGAAAADILQPDPAHCGGISEAIRIDTITSAFNLRLAPHLWAGVQCCFAGCHSSAAAPAGFTIAFSLGANPMIHDIILKATAAKKGMIAIPETPGLGFTNNEAARGIFSSPVAADFRVFTSRP